MKNRCQTVTSKIKTDFGSIYIHIDMCAKGIPVGGSISHPGKEPDSQIAVLIEKLSTGLNEALKVET